MNLCSAEHKKIKTIGFKVDDSRPFRNTMYQKNPKKIFFYDFLGWTPNKNISKEIKQNLNFQKDFPLIYEQTKLNGFI